MSFTRPVAKTSPVIQDFGSDSRPICQAAMLTGTRDGQGQCQGKFGGQRDCIGAVPLWLLQWCSVLAQFDPKLSLTSLHSSSIIFTE